MSDKALKVVGFDPATKLGTAVLAGGRLVFNYTFDFTEERGMLRLAHFRDRVVKLLAEHAPVAVVAIEGYAMARGGRGTFLAGEYGGILRLAAYDAGAGIAIVAPNTLKRFALGRAMTRADMKGKAGTAAAVEARFGIKCRDYDESDALALAWVAHGLTAAGRAAEKNSTRLDVLNELTEKALDLGADY